MELSENLVICYLIFREANYVVLIYEMGSPDRITIEEAQRHAEIIENEFREL